MSLAERIEELNAFLSGEGRLEGVWFGDLHPLYKGRFWWRAYCHALLKDAAAAIRAGGK